MKVGSLFSGIGALDLAATQVFPGAEVVWQCEPDPAAAGVLAHRFPTVPNLGDIRGIDWTAVPAVDIVTGGFPCQDLSLAGHRAGIGPGTRSGLWAHMHRAIDVLHPSWVLIENVRGLLAPIHRATPSTGHRSHTEPSGLEIVLRDLAAIGFDAQWTCLPASAIGACHRRDRFFLLAHPTGAGSPGVVVADTDSIDRVAGGQPSRPGPA